MRAACLAILLPFAAGPASTEPRTIWLQSEPGAQAAERVRIGSVAFDGEGGYDLALDGAAFSDHFLSMRPFRCVAGPDRHLCHVAYPYELPRDLGAGLTALEYDLLFVWKPAGAYGIDLWNGRYHVLEAQADGRLVGTLHEVDMDILSAPPASGVVHPIGPADLEPATPEDHWLPWLVID